MDIEEAETPDAVVTEGSTRKSERPPPIILISPVNLISFQREIKPLLRDQFSLLTSGAGIRIITHSMADYKAVLSHLNNRKLHHLIFYPKSDKHLKAVSRHLPMNTRFEDIALALQELGFDVIIAKQMKAKRSSPEGCNNCNLTPIPCDPGTLPEVINHIHPYRTPQQGHKS
jgi:hypothetical protein